VFGLEPNPPLKNVLGVLDVFPNENEEVVVLGFPKTAGLLCVVPKLKDEGEVVPENEPKPDEGVVEPPNENEEVDGAEVPEPKLNEGVLDWVVVPPPKLNVLDVDVVDAVVDPKPNPVDPVVVDIPKLGVEREPKEVFPKDGVGEAV
jgi:hypothetical protein